MGSNPTGATNYTMRLSKTGGFSEFLTSAVGPRRSHRLVAL